MAKKNDRKEYNKLKKKKADNKKQQEQCQSEIDVLDEKIERLKAAYRKLDDAINWEINTLKEKVNEKYGVLSGLVNAWDDLCTKIQNFFN